MRRYSPDLIPRVERIQQLQSLLDWSLEDIRAVLALEDQVATLRNRYHHSNSALNRQALLEEATTLTINQLTRVRQRLIGLQNLQQDLEEKLARYQALSTQSLTRGESC
jgi:DNA-binding transcriptional MerR regulator